MEYDSKTCITAFELREIGSKISEDIPDSAWVPRASLVLKGVTTALDPEDDTVIRSEVEYQLTEPFRGHQISVNYKIDF